MTMNKLKCIKENLRKKGNEIMRNIEKGAIITGFTLCSLLQSQKVNADDIYKGVRGPTNWQLDFRGSYFENEQRIKTITSNVLLKHWDGDKFGLWGFLNLPYKWINTPDKSSNGLGDISFGIGPRWKIKNSHWLSYVGLIFPTGDEKSKPVLGNGGLDAKIGLLGTYLTNDKKYELDLIA